MSYEKVYTDVVKDVIGNDPVLDQFDTYYEASFYGTMQDDFITGSIISETISNFKDSKTERKDRTFITGSRGRVLSKYYAESTPPLSSAYGSDAARLNPRLSYRLVPWSEKTSTTSYRINQHFDPSERYYDSCLPNIPQCLSVGGSRVWTNNDTGNTTRNSALLSPYGSATTGSAGYLIFNSIPQDRTGYEGDPTVNNDWTWSFPFEGKYNPGLGIRTGLSARLPIYDKREREFKSYDSSTNDTDTTPVDLVESGKTSRVEEFFPILPGYNETAPRNALRTKSNISGDLGMGKIRPGWYGPETGEEWQDKRIADINYGYSVLIPGDVNLSRLSDRDFLYTYVNASTGSMLLTQSMGTDDRIKFLFGFGDFNNMTYGRRTFDPTKFVSSYKLDVENIVTGTNPHQFSTYDSEGLKVNWAFDPYDLSDSNYHNTWCVASKQATAGGYNIVSGSTITSGIGWIPGDGGDKTIVSNTSVDYGGTMDNSGDAKSIIIVDITSSYPWNFSYDRAIAGQQNYGSFISYFAAHPGQTSHVLASRYGNQIGQQELPEYYIDYLLPGNLAGSPPINTFVTMSRYDYKEAYYPGVPSGYPAKSLGEYLLEPGEYRLVFKYSFTDPPITVPQSAALDNFEIFTYREAAFPVDESSRIGCNNYPKFKGYRFDGRLNPILSGSTGFTSNYLVSGSAATSKSIVFGVSPEIRGWKYGLYSGLPSNSKAIFRRDKFGQMRDMLEQRPYTKFINVNSSVVDDDAMTVNGFDIQTESKITFLKEVTNIGPSPAEVNFVRQRYKKDERGIGYVYNEKIDPRLTISQNLSPEVTSSLPYFDGVAKLRQEEDLLLITDATLTSLQFGPNGLTVT